MAIEGVPVAIGGGEAEHSAEMERMRNFFFFRGQEGWLTSLAGAAYPLTTPGPGILCMPGPFLVNSRFVGQNQQSYMSRILTAQQVDTTSVPPNNPGTFRHDLVVANIEDPYVSGGVDWPYPGAEGSESRREGPYWRIRVIDNVPAGTRMLKDLPQSFEERDWTAIPIARLDRPQNTATVLPEHIVNLRSIINPWSGIQLPQEILDNLELLNDTVDAIGDFLEGTINQSLPSPGEFDFFSYIGSVQYLHPSGTNGAHTAWVRWPQEAHSTILIPPWATHAHIRARIVSVAHEQWNSGTYQNGDVYGDVMVKIGTWQTLYTPFKCEIDGTNARTTLESVVKVGIGQSVRGKCYPIEIQTRLLRSFADHNGRLRADGGTRIDIEVDFKEAPY